MVWCRQATSLSLAEFDLDHYGHVTPVDPKMLTGSQI